MITATDVTRMRDQLLFEGPEKGRRSSRFWLLLVLAAVIASAGVAGDSTATVIGAMIVAPLMTPILGIVLSMVLNDRANLLRSVGLVVAGATTVIAIGFLVGLVKVEPIVAATNSQVAARVSPRLIDLLAALATGVVGSVALVRSDISDTLPGVAIAISLVPPLAVVGLTLESGAPGQALGALLLFLANVSAILATGLVTMACYGLFRSTDEIGRRMRRWTRPGVMVVAALAVLVVIPLGVSSLQIARSTAAQATVTDVATKWAGEHGWRVASVNQTADGVVVEATGPLPQPDPATLQDRLAQAGVTGTRVEVDLIPGTRSVITP